jgi:SAM-dependent methyltransferase
MIKKRSSQVNAITPRYQDFVIKDGKFIGDFEGLYKNFEDPWHQSRTDQLHDSRRSLAINWCNNLRGKYGSMRVIELGCGFGHLTQILHEQNFSAIGTDISNIAIEKARELNPGATFIQCALNEFDKLKLFDADIYLMAEITWYILDDLDLFIKNLRAAKKERNKPIFLIHLLTTYPPGIQKYGADKFTTLDEILKYFDLNYLETGFIKTPREDDANSQGTYFVAEI